MPLGEHYPITEQQGAPAMITPAITSHARSGAPWTAAHYAAGNLHDPQALPRVRQLLSRDGLALFRSVGSRAEVLALARALMTVFPHPDADPDGITLITDLGAVGKQPGAAGFSHRELSAHTDRSGACSPPALLLAVCGRPAQEGGASKLTDGLAVYQQLAAASPPAAAAFTQPRSVLFGGASGYLGEVFTPGPAPPRLQLRLRLDDLVAFAPDLQPHLPLLHAIIDRNTLTVPLAAGEGYVLDNHRWLHARETFTGTRTLYRMLGNPLPGAGIHPGIPASGAAPEGTRR
jgi:alpha-ketoglutarate-dependent taurine dioxygenase